MELLLVVLQWDGQQELLQGSQAVGNQPVGAPVGFPVVADTLGAPVVGGSSGMANRSSSGGFF